MYTIPLSPFLFGNSQCQIDLHSHGSDKLASQSARPLPATSALAHSKSALVHGGVNDAGDCQDASNNGAGRGEKVSERYPPLLLYVFEAADVKVEKETRHAREAVLHLVRLLFEACLTGTLWCEVALV